MNAPFIGPRELSASELLTDFCGQDAFLHKRIGRAADAISCASDGPRYRHMMLSSDFDDLERFVKFIRAEIGTPLSREVIRTDAIEKTIDGECVKLSGEFA